MGIFITYLLFINLVSLVIVFLDYKLIIPRVPSVVLHALELSGGIILMLPTLFLLRYRITKESYYLVSIWSLTVWFFIGYINFQILG